MQNFVFQQPSKLIFGPGRRTEFLEELKPFAPKKVLIHYGGSSAVRSGLIGMIEEKLDAAGIAYVRLGGVKPNPRLTMVEEGAALCRAECVDFILAMGGGSVIDSAKAISAGAYLEGDLWTAITSYQPIERPIPIGVILTIPATASETGMAFVISNEETQQKFLGADPAVFPKFAIIDPELYLTVPPKAYWPGICDMMSHVIERYFSATAHAELTDGICEAVLRNLIRNARRLYAGENTIEVWSELAVSANVAHNGICGIGRLPEWSCHMMEHELSATYDVTHGAGLTVLTPAWMKYIYKDHVPLFAQFAIQVMGVEANTRSLEEIAAEGIRRLEALYRLFGMPTTMQELGVPDDSQYERMAKQAVGAESDPDARLGFLHPLSADDVINIFRLSEETP